jgi:hypothetical protein
MSGMILQADVEGWKYLVCFCDACIHMHLANAVHAWPDAHCFAHPCCIAFVQVVWGLCLASYGY